MLLRPCIYRPVKSHQNHRKAKRFSMQDKREKSTSHKMEKKSVESCSSLENWFKLTFRLIVGDHWQNIAALVVDGDTTYRWCREMILHCLRELESNSDKILSSAISNVKDEIWKLRSVEFEEDKPRFGAVSVWQNTFAMAFDLVQHVRETKDKLTALKLASVAGAFECREKTHVASLKTTIFSVFSSMKSIPSDAMIHEDILETFHIFAEYLEESRIDTAEQKAQIVGDGTARKSPRGSNAWKPPESWCFGDFGDKDGQLEYPIDVLVNAKGEFLVLEENSKGQNTIQRIQLFDNKGRYMATLVQRGKNGVSSMSDMALDNEGNVVVSLKDEESVGRVRVYDMQGECVRVVDVVVSNPEFPPFFTCVAVDHVGRILAVEHNEMCVHVYGSDGTFLFKFGKWDHNAGEGTFDNIYSLHCSQAGQIYACDPFHRVHVFDNKGSFVRSFKPCGTVPTNLIVMDEQRLVYGINRDAHALEAYSLDGSKVLRKFGGFGNELGKLWSPMGTAMTPDGRIAVAERESHRIQVVKI